MKITHKNCPICNKDRKEPPKVNIPAYKDMEPGYQFAYILWCWMGILMLGGVVTAIVSIIKDIL